MKEHSKQAILIVDDEDIMLDLGQRVLSSLGLESVAVRNGARALDILKESPKSFPLALIDIVMPEIQGEALALKIRQINPRIKILFVSGYGLQEELAEKLEDGVTEFIQKPFTAEEMADRVRKLMQS